MELKHVPLHHQTQQAQEFSATVTLHRLPCKCGWVGCWHATASAAAESFKKHLKGAR